MYQGLKMVAWHGENYDTTYYGLNVGVSSHSLSPVKSTSKAFLEPTNSLIPLFLSLSKELFSPHLDFKSPLTLSPIFLHLNSCPLQSPLHSAARKMVLKHKSDLFKVFQRPPHIEMRDQIPSWGLRRPSGTWLPWSLYHLLSASVSHPPDTLNDFQILEHTLLSPTPRPLYTLVPPPSTLPSAFSIYVFSHFLLKNLFRKPPKLPTPESRVPPTGTQDPPLSLVRNVIGLQFIHSFPPLSNKLHEGRKPICAVQH